MRGLDRRLRPARTQSLTQLCGILAAQGPLAPCVDWQAVDWASVIAMATDRLLAPALWAALVRRELTALLPPPERARLKALHRQNLARNLALRAQLAEVLSALNAVAIVPLLFKGSLYLLDGTFTDLGARFQWDLDLAVAPQEYAAAVVALEALGYRPDPDRPHPHELPFVRAGSVAPLELHTNLGSPPIPEVLPFDLVAASARQLHLGSAQARGLSPTHDVIHNVLHAQVQDFNHAVGGMPVRQLHTLAWVIDAHGDAIDWVAARRIAGASDLSGVFGAYYYQAHVLFGAPAPPGVRFGPRVRMHHLRALAFWELVWPADVLRNLRYAFAAEYLAVTYASSGIQRLSFLRARHACRLLRRRGRELLADVTVARV